MTIESAGDDTSNTFTIVGTDKMVMSNRSYNGANAGTATGIKAFKTVTYNC